jgi:hypothetical protein
LLITAIVALSACASESNIPTSRFYEYWQRTPDGAGCMGIPTKYYRELFGSRGPKGEFYDSTDKDFYYAALGDVSALHRFFHSPYRDENDSAGEAWVADMVVLALIYHDEGLHFALVKEPTSVREAVGGVIEQGLFDKDKALFQKTRTLYKFRKQRADQARSQPRFTRHERLVRKQSRERSGIVL